MQKKKKIYMIGLVLATLILIADIVVFAMAKPSTADFLNRERSSFENGQRPGSSEEGNTSLEGATEANGEASMGKDGSRGRGRGNRPDNLESGEMSEGADLENMPQNFDPENMPEGMELQTSSRGLSTIQKVCIPVGILCILVDLICAIGLFRIAKAKKKQKAEDGSIFQVEGENGEPEKKLEAPLDPAEERLRKKEKNRKKWMGMLSLLLIGAILLQVLSSGAGVNSSSTVKEEVISAQVEDGDINQTLKSSGILASAKDVAISVPGDVAVTKYLVENGDSVAEGDPIAVVEKNTVMAAIADIQELLDELDEKMEDAKEESISSSIKASVDGTVVAVYASKGKSVVDVMYDKGALILISLDDLLAVKIDNSGDLTVGTEVTVTDSDGSSHTGQVASIEKDTVVITVPLSKFSYKEKVTVKNSDGEKLGSGKLYIYSQQKITGYSGTVGSVKVEKGYTVSAGNTLLTLTDTDYTAAYQTLLNKRVVLEEQYNQLVEIGNSGYVYANEAGTIAGVDENLLVASTAESSDDTAKAAAVETASAVKASSGTVSGKNTGFVSVGFRTVSTETANSGTETTTQATTETTNATTEATEETTTEEITETTPAETVSKTVNVVWLKEDGTVMTEGIPENITVQLWAGDQMVEEKTINKENEWKYTWSGLAKYNGDGTEIVYTVKEKDALTGYTLTSQSTGTVTLLICTKQVEQSNAPENGKDENTTQMPEAGGIANGTAPSGNGINSGVSKNNSGSSMNGGTMGNLNSAAGSGASTTESEAQTEDNSYVFEETEICSLSPNDTVEVDITIDELDINSIDTGQECMITLDAFPGQSFTGTVSYINKSGENSGGNTKYTVTISMEKQEDMLLGMNASVQIVMSSQTNILIIPEAALVEQGDGVYVYTEYNKKSDELGGLTEVTTGISDGENVQIVEGLEAEQEYYYRYADTISYTFVK